MPGYLIKTEQKTALTSLVIENFLFIMAYSLAGSIKKFRLRMERNIFPFVCIKMVLKDLKLSLHCHLWTSPPLKIPPLGSAAHNFGNHWTIPVGFHCDSLYNINPFCREFTEYLTIRQLKCYSTLSIGIQLIVNISLFSTVDST